MKTVFLHSAGVKQGSKYYFFGGSNMMKGKENLRKTLQKPKCFNTHIHIHMHSTHTHAHTNTQVHVLVSPGVHEALQRN